MKDKKKLTDKMKAIFKKKGLDENGRELMDSTPNRIALGLGEQKSEPLHKMVKRMIRENADRIALEQGDETFEEANDFDVEDDYPVETNYERDFDTQVPNRVMEKHILDLEKKVKESHEQMVKLQTQIEQKGDKNGQNDKNDVN